MSTVPIDPQIGPTGPPGPDLDVARDSDVPISTQIYWQLVYQIDAGGRLPGARLLPVRELGAALRVNPNTIRAVYRRLADAGYVMSRHGAGTVVAERPPTRRRPEALAGIVSEMIRRAAQAGFTADEVASAIFAAASERRRPGPAVPILFAGRRIRRAAPERRVPRPDRGRGNPPRRDPRATRPLPLRPRGDDDLPCRRGPGPRPGPGAGRGDARRAGVRGARPRGLRPSGRLPRRGRLRVRAQCGQH